MQEMMELKMSGKWAGLSPYEKQEARFRLWLSPDGVKFVRTEAEKAYKERVNRLISAIKLKESDRVPVMMPPGFSPVYCAGEKLHKVMYDYDELRRLWLKFLHDFDTDAYCGPELVFPGKVFDSIDFKSFKWPGHGLSPDAPTYQYIEGEYMKADEYDILINDPSDFWMRIYLPRVIGAFEPFKRLMPLNPLVGIPVGHLIAYGMPDIQAALQILLDAGKESAKWAAVTADCNRKILEIGVPLIYGGIAMAPFDGIADMVRGTNGTMLDMYRQPEKLLEAMKKITPMTIGAAVSGADASGCPLVFMPLHKGDDGFMSQKQFETFYWPTLKEVCLGLINEGIVPLLLAEGKYNTRLEIIKDLPRGAAVWWFEQTDMARAKKILGDTLCICGNVPAPMLSTGTPGEVKEYCQKLIEVASKGGGLILTSGAYTDQGNPDNLRAMMEAAKEYGIY